METEYRTNEVYCMLCIEKLESIQYSFNFLPISQFYWLFHNKSAFDFQATRNFNSAYFSPLYMTTMAAEPPGCQGRAQIYQSHKTPLCHSTSRTNRSLTFPFSFILSFSHANLRLVNSHFSFNNERQNSLSLQNKGKGKGKGKVEGGGEGEGEGEGEGKGKGKGKGKCKGKGKGKGEGEGKGKGKGKGEGKFTIEQATKAQRGVEV